MSLRTYDPNKFPVSFAGIKINEGLAEGTFITVRSDAPGFTKTSGVDGTTTRSRSHVRTATVTLTLMQSSPINDKLSALYNDDRNAINGRGVGAFQMKDLNGTTRVESPKAYISNDPEITLGAEVSERQWEITLVDVAIVHGGGTAD